MDQINALIDALHLHNWYALAALILTIAVQAFRKAPGSSKLWAKIPDGYRWALPVVSGAVTGFTQAYAAGLNLGSALLAAAGGAVGISIPAMGLNSLLTEAPVRWNGGAGGAQVKVKDDGPKLPPMFPGAGVFLLMLTVSLFSACALFGSGGSVWPKLGACAPSTDTLFSEVESVLTSSGGNYEDDLLALGKSEGLSFVECAVKSVVESLSARIAARRPGERITPDEGIGVARGKAFLAKIGTEK
jgi:hypothetical protein